MEKSNIITYLRKCLFWPLVVLGTHTLILGGTEVISGLCSQKIKSYSELEPMIREERKKLGIKEDVCIDVRLSQDWKEILSTQIEKKYEGEYEILLGPFDQNIVSLRHELYHLVDGECENQSRDYLHLHETKAALYGIGVKI